MSELKKCPFCGHNDELKEVEYSIVCGVCGCEGAHGTSEISHPLGIDLNDKVKAWNTRADGWRDNMDDAPRGERILVKLDNGSIMEAERIGLGFKPCYFSSCDINPVKWMLLPQ